MAKDKLSKALSNACWTRMESHNGAEKTVTGYEITHGKVSADNGLQKAKAATNEIAAWLAQNDVTKDVNGKPELREAVLYKDRYDHEDGYRITLSRETDNLKRVESLIKAHRVSQTVQLVQLQKALPGFRDGYAAEDTTPQERSWAHRTQRKHKDSPETDTPSLFS